jgi:hypothetical protein
MLGQRRRQVNALRGEGRRGCATYKWETSRPARFPVILKAAVEMGAARRAKIALHLTFSCDPSILKGFAPAYGLYGEEVQQARPI